MKQTDALKQFAREGNRPVLKATSNCVIYTRVSTKEQAEGNYSLETQRKLCEDYAVKRGFTIEAFFGGTYESAKSDERKEFNRMLQFIKTCRNKISHVVVCYPDRFSRTGANAIYIAAELRKRGVLIDTVHQNTDTSNASGEMMQNMQFIMSSYDNQLRKERCVGGMVEKLKRGYWIGCAPLGYQYEKPEKGEEQRIVIAQDGQFIKKAFELKAYERLKTSEIVKKLCLLGYTITEKRLSETFRNVFYCGKISHALIPGEILEGQHPALISEETFLLANEALAKNPQNYKANPQDEHLPLRRTLKCACCGTAMTGYLVKKKSKYYYKCNTKGCNNNRSAEFLHQKFTSLLAQFSVNQNYTALLEKQLRYVYDYLNQSKQQAAATLKHRSSEVRKRIEQIEERFILGEVDKGLYEKYRAKYQDELAMIEAEAAQMQTGLSNPEKFISLSVKMCANLNKMWTSGNYDQKQEIQRIAFPEGFSYDRKNDDYRTGRVNEVFQLLAGVSRDLEDNKKREDDFSINLPVVVDQSTKISNQSKDDLAIVVAFSNIYIHDTTNRCVL